MSCTWTDVSKILSQTECTTWILAGITIANEVAFTVQDLFPIQL